MFQQFVTNWQASKLFCIHLRTGVFSAELSILMGMIVHHDIKAGVTVQVELKFGVVWRNKQSHTWLCSLDRLANLSLEISNGMHRQSKACKLICDKRRNDGVRAIYCRPNTIAEPVMEH